MRGTGLKFHWGGLDWILEKESSQEEWLDTGMGYPREVLESPPLLMFKNHVDVASGGMV